MGMKTILVALLLGSALAADNLREDSKEGTRKSSQSHDCGRAAAGESRAACRGAAPCTPNLIEVGICGLRLYFFPELR